MFAVIATGGKQYIVREGDVLSVEMLGTEAGKNITFDVLLVSDANESKATFGAPFVKGASVTASVVEHGKADKVSVVKYKPKVRYRRNVGHRQPFTKIKIEKISA